MTLSKHTLITQLADRESSCEQLEQLAMLYQTENPSHVAPQPSARRESLRRRSLQPGLVLGPTRTPTLMTEQPALESLLRRLGLSPESALHPRLEDGGAHGLHEKRIQMSEALQQLGNAAEAPLVTHLSSSDHASQLLTSSLHANSHYGTSLRDPEQEDALSGLEAELASLQTGVRNLNLDVLHQRDKNHDKFLERWR